MLFYFFYISETRSFECEIAVNLHNSFNVTAYVCKQTYRRARAYALTLKNQHENTTLHKGWLSHFSRIKINQLIIPVNSCGYFFLLGCVMESLCLNWCLCICVKDTSSLFNLSPLAISLQCLHCWSSFFFVWVCIFYAMVCFLLHQQIRK